MLYSQPQSHMSSPLQPVDYNWSELLNRLRAINNQIDPAPSQHLTIRDFCETEFLRIKSLLQHEMQIFKKHHPEFILPTMRPRATISHIEIYDDILEAANRAIIEPVVIKAMKEGSDELNMECFNITRIPKSLLEEPTYKPFWQNLKTLNCRENLLRTLPDEITTLVNLEDLYLYDNKFNILPRGIIQLRNLKHLDISENCLTELPETIDHLQQLRSLYCGTNKISSLPKTIGNLKNLKRFGCSSNLLTSLPDALGNLDKLKELECEDNKLTCLPESIGKCEKLISLNCTDNCLHHFPDSLAKFAHQLDVEYDNNPLEELPSFIKKNKAETLSEEAKAEFAKLWELVSKQITRNKPAEQSSTLPQSDKQEEPVTTAGEKRERRKEEAMGAPHKKTRHS